MAKRDPHKGRSRGSRGKPRHRRLPNWPVLALALAGMALTAYLTVTDWLEAAPVACGEGSSCDVVQESRWSMLLGLPIAFWGFLTYAAIGHVAWRVKTERRHWQFLWLLALAGLAVSVYLTAISLVVIQAACSYCLASLALMAALFGVVVWQTPRGMAGFSWPGWLAESGVLAAVVIVALHLHYSGVFSPGAGPEDPYLRTLAQHLEASGAKFYGAQWCGACAQQKAIFGASAGRLPYVECSPQGRGGARAPVCVERGISSYPTWIIESERVTGVLQPDELARRTNFIPRGQAAR